MASSMLALMLPLLLAFAAAHDLFTMKIPNKICLGIVTAFVMAALWYKLPLPSVAMHAAVSLAVLLVTYVLFSYNYIGGGDAKLMAATALWMGPAFTLQFVVGFTIFGGLLSLALLTYRRCTPEVLLGLLPSWAVRLHTRGGGVPYGIAIAASALMLYPETPWWQGVTG